MITRVTRAEMEAWSRWHRQTVLARAQQKRQEAVAPVMKKPQPAKAPQQLRMF